MSIKIITDSASDMIYGDREGVSFQPLSVYFGGQEYLDGVTLSHKEFYEKLIESDQLPTTSQVPPAKFEEAYRKIREDGDQAIVITISSKLSGTYQSAVIAAEDYEDCIYVVDSLNVTIGEQVLIDYAIRLRDQGMAIADIVAELNREKEHIHLIALLDTLEYLKKGGRISAATAFAGTLLSMKPVISIQEGEVQLMGKARGSKQGNNLLVQYIEKNGGIDYSRPFHLGYTGLNDDLLQKFIKDSAALWEGKVDSLPIASVGSAIGTHSGPGAIAVAFFGNK